jgi:hypothetical protein
MGERGRVHRGLTWINLGPSYPGPASRPRTWTARLVLLVSPDSDRSAARPRHQRDALASRSCLGCVTGRGRGRGSASRSADRAGRGTQSPCLVGAFGFVTFGLVHSRGRRRPGRRRRSHAAFQARPQVHSGGLTDQRPGSHDRQGTQVGDQVKAGVYGQSGAGTVGRQTQSFHRLGRPDCGDGRAGRPVPETGGAVRAGSAAASVMDAVRHRRPPTAVHPPPAGGPTTRRHAGQDPRSATRSGRVRLVTPGGPRR